MNSTSVAWVNLTRYSDSRVNSSSVEGLNLSRDSDSSSVEWLNLSGIQTAERTVTVWND